MKEDILGRLQMELKIQDQKIIFNKELNNLDKMALNFSEVLSQMGIKHVFLSGYLAILFGRNRTSEDIDVVCEKVSFKTFTKLWESIHKELECIITSDVHTAYNEYLQKSTAIRFAYKGEFIPNVEMKFETTKMHREALSSPLLVVVNGRDLPISPLEQQIAYKLFMGSEKDIEDARFLFKLFEENIDKTKLSTFLEALKISLPLAERYLGWLN
ncbi:MAG: hypothetical protein JSV09_11525 [Thermoplasmata archaeon]|nr:MAG: hypothetical protein JSV09_11525 [Thermoplasmata archaeon]